MTGGTLGLIAALVAVVAIALWGAWRAGRALGRREVWHEVAETIAASNVETRQRIDDAIADLPDPDAARQWLRDTIGHDPC